MSSFLGIRVRRETVLSELRVFFVHVLNITAYFFPCYFAKNVDVGDPQLFDLSLEF